jgi:hypothetical protein
MGASARHRRGTLEGKLSVRKIRAANAAASVPRYDLLLKIDDAGIIDEYIYDTMRKALGEGPATWLLGHADRKQAFEDWARKE